MAAIEAARANTARLTGVGAKGAVVERAEHELLNINIADAARRLCFKHLRKAISAFKRADYGKAAYLALDATEADPSCGQAYHILALSFDNLGDMARAMAMYERAYALSPDDFDLLLNLGLAAWRMDMLDVAEKLFRRFCDIAPEQAVGWNNLAGVLRDTSRFDDAIEICRAAIYRLPDQPLLWNTLGTILVELSEFDQATVFYKEALRLNPGFGRAWHNLGYGLAHTGPFDQAVAAYDKALDLIIEPRDRIEVEHARALGLISMGRLEEGFAAYEVRHNHQHKASSLYAIDAPMWRGEDLTGKNLLVVAEQGLGDEVMFANTLPDLQLAVGCGGTLQVAVDTRLHALFQRSYPSAKIGSYITTRHNAKDVRHVPWAGKPDYVTPLGSALPFLRPSLDRFPRQAYLVPDAARTQAFGDDLAVLKGLKVGICWRSMKINAQRQKYYSAIDMWEPILTTPGVSFVNLQYGDASAELARAKDLFGIDIHSIDGLDLKQDLDGAAALSSLCDVVISAPTAAAALAGAVGADVWFLTAGVTWPQLGADHYPWYRSSRVYCPSAFGDWSSIMPRIAAELATRADG